MAGLLQTGTISRYNTAESHSLMHYSQLCGTHQPRLCALELLPKEFTGAGRELLKSQLAILSEPDNNPFITDSVHIDENDIADATPEFMLLDSDSEEE